MKDDFGYFGSGLEGYVQYNEAFKRNFDCVSTPDSIPKEDVLDLESEDESSIESDTDFESADNDLSDDDK